jgi:alkylation response protein AidB-like acyl-CoA dehydrogenase
MVTSGDIGVKSPRHRVQAHGLRYPAAPCDGCPVTISPSSESINDLRARWLETARSVSALVSAEADEVERAGALTPVVIEALRDAELFWTLLPAAFGGGEADIVTGLQVIEEISRADGSTGWSLMANMTGAAVACAYLPDRALDVIFADGRPICAGVLAPKGSAVPVDGGYVINGNFQFGSGIGYADWVGAGVFVREDGKVRSRPSGEPDIRSFYVPRSAVELRGNWDVMGLNGTGSQDYRVVDQIAAEEFSLLLPDPVPQRSIPSYQLGLVPLGGAGHGAVAIGIALRAFEELVAIARRKRRPGQPGVIEQPHFLYEYAVKDASLQAARRLFYGSFQDAYDAAVSTGEVTSLQKQQMRQAVTYITQVAADVVRWCYTWAGSEGLRNPSPMGRCMRDISAATQHIFVDANTLISVAPDLIAAVGPSTA